MIWIAVALLAAAAALALAWRLLRRIYPLPTPSDEVHHAPTSDGWALALHRYRPDRPTPGREPVILCHGMLSNRFNVDLDEEVSLARYLRERGLDVWVLELRGHGHSRRGGGASVRPYDWNLDDYIQKDLPAAVSYVRKATGANAVHWFGHSMGGMILYAACALPALDGAIRSAVVCDSPASFGPLRTRVGLARLYGRMVPVVPPALVLPMLGPVAWLMPGIMSPRYGLEERRLVMTILANAIIPWGSSRTLLQFCDMLESGRFLSSDGAVDYEAGAARVAFPILVLSTARKIMVERAITLGFTRAASEDKTYERLTVEAGYSTDYTHSNVLVSRSSRREVYPLIAEWLVARSTA